MKKKRQKIKIGTITIFRDESGQGMAEYVIIVVSLVAATVFVDSAFREALRRFYNFFSNVVGGPRL